MNATKKTDLLIYLIGVALIIFVLIKVIGYILPDRSPYQDPQRLLSDVMQKHATTRDWNQNKHLSFNKDFTLYLEDGSVEMARKERHNYAYAPITKSEIRWTHESLQYHLRKTKNGISQTVDKVQDTSYTDTQLHAKLDAAQFVMNLPHSLQSKNADLEYEGIQPFQDSQCHTLKVRFKNSEDVWTMYFSENSLAWLGYWVKTSGHYSLVINEEMIVVDGFTLSRKRKSYRTDSLQNKTYLRAKYTYDNYVIN